MGAYSSTHLTPEEIEELATQTNYNNKEIVQLYHRFKKLDRTRSGVISGKDFSLVSELSLNPMAPRILHLFQTDAGEDAVTSGGVTFDVFVKTLNFFNAKTPASVKLDKLFRAYDIDGDGKVSERDLFHVLKFYTGPHLSEATSRVLVRRAMQNALNECGGDKKPVAKKSNADSTTSGELSDEVGLSLEEFSRIITKQGLDALVVNVPIQTS